MKLDPTELTPAELGLQAEVREFLGERLPRGSYEVGLGMVGGSDPAFSRDLGARGWLGMALPREFGGGGRSAVERLIVVEELLAVGAPVAYHWVGDRQSGTNIVRNGTSEQKEYFLPRICAGEVSFAIGMSEPDSGSDLASVRTRAVRVDGGWLVNGTKVWTTGAHQATHILGLFRTGEHKYRGLTQFIVEAGTPGLRISPIPFIDGSEDFCELSFQDCFIPDTCRLGPEGGGWGQNTDELALERGGVDRWMSTMTILDAWVAGTGESAPESLVREVGALAAQLWALRGMSLSIARMVDRHDSPVLAAALVKEMATRFERDSLEVVMRHRGRVPSLVSTDQLESLLARAVLVSPSWTIRGGTNEVLRNVIAKGLMAS
jgi:3-oxocholest-4-en-26-oyl-CoA dehydrogenase alpha subunit